MQATRPLEIPPSVVTMLLERQIAQGRNPIDSVFPSRVGTWTPYSTVYRRWNDATRGDEVRLGYVQDVPQAGGDPDRAGTRREGRKDQLGHAHEVTTETFYIAQSVDAPKVSELIERFIRDSAPTG